MSVLYRAGHGWCDVCPTPDGFAFVYSVDGAVVCEVNEQERWRVAVPTDHLRYLRCALSPYGEVEAVGVGADDIAYLVGRMGVERWGPAFGQNSVGLYHDGLFQPVIQRSSESYSIGRDHPWVAFPPDIRGTSQGFRDVYPDGNIVFGDDAHVVTLEGHSFHKPNTRGDVTVGQINGTDQIDGWHRADRVRFTAIPGPAFEPHVAQRGLQYAICARTPHGAALVIVPPYQTVEEPVAQLDTIRAIRRNYPTPLGATHAQLLLDCAAATKMGLLRKTGGTRIALPPPHFQNGFPIEVSQDILMDPASGRIYDFLGDAEGAATPGWSEAVGSPQPLERIYVPTGDVPPPPPPPDPPDTTWQREIERRLTALEQAKFTIEVVRR
jgi:hypothetical protein